MRHLWEQLYGMTIRVGLGINKDQIVRPGTAERKDVTYRVLCCILSDTEHEKGKVASFGNPPCFHLLSGCYVFGKPRAPVRVEHGVAYQYVPECCMNDHVRQELFVARDS